eukprot:350371-Chlamydomonas_euryale.AAC.6
MSVLCPRVLRAQVVSSGDGGSPVRAGGVALPTSVMLSGRTGTYMYMAPEMFQSKSYDERVDVFSFGVMVYEMVHKYMMVFAITLKGTEEEIEAYARKVWRQAPWQGRRA